jgi:hypothetical protein
LTTNHKDYGSRDSSVTSTTSKPDLTIAWQQRAQDPMKEHGHEHASSNIEQQQQQQQQQQQHQQSQERGLEHQSKLEQQQCNRLFHQGTKLYLQHPIVHSKFQRQQIPTRFRNKDLVYTGPVIHRTISFNSNSKHQEEETAVQRGNSNEVYIPKYKGYKYLA